MKTMTIGFRTCRTLLATLALLAAAGAAEPVVRGGRVGWARLVTPHSGWDLHSDQDPKLASFIREETTLNIDPVWYSVEARRIEDLCTYPFIYVKDVTRIRDRGQLENLKEYLQRGGFLCIDPCTTHFRGNDAENFLRRHGELITGMIPGSVYRELPPEHPIFRCYFAVGVKDVFTDDMLALGLGSRPSKLDVVGVFHENRLIAVISVLGLECGWPQTPQRRPGCMKMIVNFYVHAMTGGAAYDLSK